ncbi:hypothetical protein L1987_20768 [Smallanthus sonchifolius]|uniref:Uncharacterized protein n=1 Tax=Smallanthus sonchifolius TaxID=185202 RepID=A0ACB9IT87_9ASTR|nr:hypothetical protein L1987_20768 [Smallanthus sonchifolius]
MVTKLKWKERSEGLLDETKARQEHSISVIGVPSVDEVLDGASCTKVESQTLASNLNGSDTTLTYSNNRTQRVKPDPNMYRRFLFDSWVPSLRTNFFPRGRE